MIQIIGAGAIGCLWLAKLLQARQSCHIVSRAADPQTKLSFTDLTGTLHLLAISHSHQLLHSNKVEQSSIILVCVKAQHVLNALLTQQEFINNEQTIILMHNGYGCAEEVAKHFPDNLLICATTSNASLLNAPLNISHTGIGPTYFGAFNAVNKSTLQSLPALIVPFKQCMQDVHWSEAILEKYWLKLAINAVINPLTAVNQIKNGQLGEQKYEGIIERLILEVFDIAKAEKINVALDSLKETIPLVITATAENYSSMNRDLYYQRESEIEFINGYLIRQAQYHKINVPTLTEYYQKIKSLESSY